MANITWELYDSLYDKISEEKFPTVEKEAESIVRGVIGPVGYAQITPDTFGYDVLQETIMKVMNLIVDNEKSGVGKGITSVSNDGYSESYAQTTREEVDAEMRSTVVSMLSGTGLVGAY